jgi:lactoylglutathione lyase
MSYKFTYTRLLVSDFKACYQFYRDVMGFQPTFGNEDDVYADFDTGEVVIALFNRLLMSKAIETTYLPADAKVQDKICLIFAVDDVDAACRQLKTQGVSLIAEPADHPDWGLRSAYLRDPDGNLIEINQPLLHL